MPRRRRKGVVFVASCCALGCPRAWPSHGKRVRQRGFNPHHRKVPSYHPITAYEAQSGKVLRVQNRPGNVHDGKGALQFLRDLSAQLRATLDVGPTPAVSERFKRLDRLLAA